MSFPGGTPVTGPRSLLGVLQSQMGGIPSLDKGIPQSQMGVPHLWRGVAHLWMGVPSPRWGTPSLGEGVPQSQMEGTPWWSTPRPGQDSVPLPRMGYLPPAPRIGQQMERLIRGGQCASWVHVGGPSSCNLLHYCYFLLMSTNTF